MRDTDTDWRTIAEIQPYYSVLTNEKFLLKNLTQESLEEFYRSGETDINYAMKALEHYFGVHQFASALDFGCGVGRQTFAMCKHAKSVTGVDIAPAMLQRARQWRDAAGQANIEFAQEIPTDATYDWINSAIVFQHIPPRRGLEILAQLVMRLRNTGAISIQLTLYREARQLGEMVRNIRTCTFDGEIMNVLSANDDVPASMSMFDYSANKVLKTLYDGGISPVLLEHTDHGGCHGAKVFGVKQP